MSGLINKTLSTGDMTPQLIGTVPEGIYASINIIIINPDVDSGSGELEGSSEVEVTLYFSNKTSDPDPVDMVDYKAVIPARGRYVYACSVMSEGENIFLHTEAAGLVVRVEGIVAE